MRWVWWNLRRITGAIKRAGSLGLNWLSARTRVAPRPLRLEAEAPPPVRDHPREPRAVVLDGPHDPASLIVGRGPFRGCPWLPPDQDTAPAHLAKRVLTIYPRCERMARDMLTRIGNRLPHPVNRGADDHLVRNILHRQRLLWPKPRGLYR